MRDTAGWMGDKPLKRREEADEVFFQSARVERGEETLLRSCNRRKALKGKAQECWELKEAFKDFREAGDRRHIERVAKPEGVTSLDPGQRDLRRRSGNGTTENGAS